MGPSDVATDFDPWAEIEDRFGREAIEKAIENGIALPCNRHQREYVHRHGVVDQGYCLMDWDKFEDLMGRVDKTDDVGGWTGDKMS